MNMQPIIYNGQKVITTELLAQAYMTTPDGIRHNYNRNKERFTDGKHFFCLSGEELKAFKRDMSESPVAIPANTNQFYLWTERGANRHCKILDTDKAWEQFDNLEETYFRAKSGACSLSHVPPSVSPGGIAALINTNRRIMREAGNLPVEIAAMAQGVLIQFGITLPEVCTKDIPEQMSLFGRGNR